MDFNAIEVELVSEGLHEESVSRMVDHYEQMRFHLGIERYIETGTHVGNFCEALVNILRDYVGEAPQNDVQVRAFINRAQSNGYEVELQDEFSTTVPRLLSAAYELRSKRDTVHTNLEIPVSRSDAQTAVRLCTWLLCELLRIFGDRDHHDQIADYIESLATPIVPYIDQHEGTRLIMSTDLEVQQEVLVHLYVMGTTVPQDELVEWIPGASPKQVGGALGALKQQRKIHFEDGMAKITPIGAQEAQAIVDEHLDMGQ